MTAIGNIWGLFADIGSNSRGNGHFPACVPGGLILRTSLFWVSELIPQKYVLPDPRHLSGWVFCVKLSVANSPRDSPPPQKTDLTGKHAHYRCSHPIPPPLLFSSTPSILRLTISLSLATWRAKSSGYKTAWQWRLCGTEDFINIALGVIKWAVKTNCSVASSRELGFRRTLAQNAPASIRCSESVVLSSFCNSRVHHQFQFNPSFQVSLTSRQNSPSKQKSFKL